VGGSLNNRKYVFKNSIWAVQSSFKIGLLFSGDGIILPFQYVVYVIGW
jgi:hypothetical protein